MNRVLEAGVLLEGASDHGVSEAIYLRDPDGYLIEVGQATGVLEGRLAKIRPEDMPG